MRISIISTGDELLKGQISDTNGAWICAEFFTLGYMVEKIQVVSDDLEQLTEAIRFSVSNFDLTIVGGGLGPTVDDLTSEAAAAALDLPIKQNQTAVAQIIERFEKMNRKMDPVNLNQALFPKGANLLSNLNGTAPGFSLTKNSNKIFFLPGPPGEMKPMFKKYVIDTLDTDSNRLPHTIFKCFGLGESNLQTMLTPVSKKYPNLKFAFRASFFEIALTIFSNDTTVLKNAGDEITKLVEPYVFSNKITTLPIVAGELLAAKKLTVATAESCTGGLIANNLTDNSGATAYFKGGIVAYDNSVKINQLNVSSDTLEKYGAVSRQVVEAMATGVCKTIGTNIGIATSGIAGPTGGTKDKPVGLVHIAIAINGRLIHKECNFHGYPREKVKRASTMTVLKLLIDNIKN